MDRTRHKSAASRIRRLVLIGALVLAVTGCGIVLMNIDFSTHRVDRTKVSIETVQAGTLKITVSANGELLSKNIEEIASQVAGRVAKTDIKAGTHVQAGQLLVELTNAQLQTAEEEARSACDGAIAEEHAAEADLQTSMLNQEGSVVQAQFRLQEAQLQLEAERPLEAEHIIPEIQFKRSVLNVDQLTKLRDIEASRLQKVRGNIQIELAVKRSRVTQLARELDRARNQVANLRVAAGISGVVQAINVEVGQQLQPGTLIGRVAQENTLYAELKVPAREATDVQVGQSVLIDTRSGTVNGVVTRVDPGVTAGTVIVDVDLRSELPAGARPQLQVEGSIYVSQIPDTLYVGKPSYLKSNAAVTVYKLDAAGKYASRVTVRAGKISVAYMQVLQGLHAGDRIITSEVGEWQDQDRIMLN